MAFVQLLAQTTVSSPTVLPPVTATAGTPGVTPAQDIPAGTMQVTYRLTSTNWVASADLLDWHLDRNDLDGRGWRELTSGITPEGAVNSRTGAMPSVSYQPGGQVQGVLQPLDHAIQLRVRFRVQGSLPFGIEQEVL